VAERQEGERLGAPARPLRLPPVGRALPVPQAPPSNW